ncbi:iron ABC transporter permease [Klebsiella variicola]|uniref:Iron ABC transporter permease n=1 Tax=Klebsiella variicola TaxID=244366 RepID=A0A7H4MH07_KLEVA|nr:iron ABC transporter permease [Klebsiella variicola]
MLAMGVPLLVLCRWLWLGGIDNWLHADLWHSLRQTLLLGAGGALLTTVCAIPIAWLGVRYPRPLFRLLEGCNYITSSLPGIVTALALVTVTIHYAPSGVPDRSDAVSGLSVDVYAACAD